MMPQLWSIALLLCPKFISCIWSTFHLMDQLNLLYHRVERMSFGIIFLPNAWYLSASWWWWRSMASYWYYSTGNFFFVKRVILMDLNWNSFVQIEDCGLRAASCKSTLTVATQKFKSSDICYLLSVTQDFLYQKDYMCTKNKHSGFSYFTSRQICLLHI